MSSHKHAPQVSISSVIDASETSLLGPDLSDVFEMRPIEPLNSNIFQPQSSSHKSSKLDSYDLRLRNRKFHWKTPLLSIVFFGSGTALAIDHHIYLSSLDGNPNTNQSWTGRFSLAFAFLTKTCFSAAVALAMKQVLWYTFRRTRKGISFPPSTPSLKSNKTHSTSYIPIFGPLVSRSLSSQCSCGFSRLSLWCRPPPYRQPSHQLLQPIQDVLSRVSTSR